MFFNLIWYKIRVLIDVVKMFIIKQIEYSDVLPLRKKGLETNELELNTFLDADQSNESFHFGIFDQEKLIGICTFLKNMQQEVTNNAVYQLLEISIDNKYTERNLDWNLLVHAEAYLKSINSVLVWCNANEASVSFYEKNGYQVNQKMFKNSETGVHKVMCKVL